MATSKSYFEFIKEQLSDLDGIAFRAMMGEYIIYYGGKVVGGIYDDRFLVKPTESLLVDNVESRKFLAELIPAVAADLPEPKAKKKK